MEVTCSECKTKLNVPDEKIPRDQMVRINCPKCKSKITIDSRKNAREESSDSEDFTKTGKLHLKFIEPKHEKPPEEEGYSYDDYSDDADLDFFEEDTKLALIMAADNDQSEKIKTAVQGLGYKCVAPKNTRDALGKMRFHHFDLVFLTAGFDGQELGNNPVLNHLNHLSMSSRRMIFLALMGDRLKTMDSMMSYAMSANTVITSKDIESLSSILKKSIKEHEKFYKVFMDTLVEAGKA